MEGREHPNILHVVPDLNPGGSQRSILDKISWCNEKEIVSTVGSSGGIWTSRLDSLDVPHVEIDVNTGNPLRIYSAAGEIRHLIDKTGINLVCAYTPGPSWACHLATIASPLHEPPLVTYAADLYPKGTFSNAIKYGDRIVAVSDIARKHLIDELKADGNLIRRIHVGFEKNGYPVSDVDTIDRMKRAWEIPHNAKIIAGIGRFEKDRGWELLIDAMATLPGPKPFLVLVGSTYGSNKKYLAHLQGKIDSLNKSNPHLNSPLVRFVGHIENIADIYSVCDLVVLPGNQPVPFGYQVLEALSLDCPIISPFNSGPAEILLPMMKDFYYEPGSVESIVSKITGVLGNYDSAMIRTRWLAKTIAEKLTIDRQMRAEIKLFREITPGISWPDV